MRRSTLRAGATLRMVWYELCMHCAACFSMRVISMSCYAVMHVRDCDYILSSSRLASSKPRNVAPFANGDLWGWKGTGTGAASAGRPSVWDPRRRTEMAGAGAGTGTEGNSEAYLMSVGPSPRVNAGRPSVRQTVRTQSRVDLYFCPSLAEKPSVCIRDLIMSMG